MSVPNIAADHNTQLEASLKDLLDKMLNYFEKFLKSKEDLATLENKLRDYENLLELVEISKEVFNGLTKAIDEKLETQDNENYNELEKILQKHEGEIRNHIRIEQQLKLYSESIQAKLDESEKTRADLVEQTKTMINNVKRENERLTEALKEKIEENEMLTLNIKNLEEANKGFKEKLQELPNLQERINNLEKQSKFTGINTRSGNLLKDSSQNSRDAENSKKIDVETEPLRINSKPESDRKSIKTINANQYASPLKFISKTLSNTPGQSNKNKEYIKVKIEMSDNRHHKELEALKHSYQRFYNPAKGDNKDRSRNASSVTKTRELKSIYSIPLVTHSSNTSLIQSNQHLSHRDHVLSKVHHRSNSYGGKNKSRNSFVKLEDNL